MSATVLYRDAGAHDGGLLDDGPRSFHRRLPGYASTPVRHAPAAAARLGVGRVLVKDESQRLGLPSFKLLGASWATYRVLVQRLGHEPAWSDVTELAAALRPLRPLTLATATDGNHGRALARIAALLGFSTRVYVPADLARARVDAIAAEGATVVPIVGTYDDAVAAVVEDDRTVVVSDMSWPGYEEVPGWVIDGYATIFEELDEQLVGSLAVEGAARPSVVTVPVGVGALGAAAVRHYRRAEASARPRLVSVEPAGAACLLESVRAGKPTSVPGPHRSIMAGLNCGRPSIVAWPDTSTGFDAYLAIEDEHARDAMRVLADDGIAAGESGAAGLGGLLAVVSAADEADHRRRLGLTSEATVLALSTEGATDPVGWERVVGRPPPDPTTRR